MAAADLHLGKPGGLSSAESLASGLPMVLTGALPGQEEANAHYLLEIGAAVEGGVPAVAALLLDRHRLASLRAAASRAGLPLSAFWAVSEIAALALAGVVER